MRVICLVLLIIGCKVHDDSNSDTAFIGYPQVSVFSDLTFLISKVHEPSWTIGYYFGDRCGVRPKRAQLKQQVTDMINIWLAPIRELSLVQRKVVDDFRFKDLQNTSNKDNEYFRDASSKIDMFIKFDCDPQLSLRSHVLIGDHSPIIVMHKSSQANNVTGYHPHTLLHELGHTMGLLDTYAFYNSAVKGESYDYFYTSGYATIGNHPPSVMSATRFKSGDDYIISGDDKKGIIWLYMNYFYPQEIDKDNECYFPTHELEVLHRDGYKGCVPTNPLIFMIKNGYPIESIRSLAYREPALQRLINRKERLGDQLTFFHYAAMMPDNQAIDLFLNYRQGLIKYANINIIDRQGRTPLHYAIMAGNNRIVDYLVSDNTWESAPIDLSIKLPNGMTYLHWAVQFADPNATCLLLEYGNIDETFEDKWNLTPLERANSRARYWKKKGNQPNTDKMNEIIAMLRNDDHSCR